MDPSHLFAIAFGMFFALAGLLLTSAGLKSFNTARRARTWPTVDATLDKCEVVPSASSAGNRPNYRIMLAYRYQIAGVDYSGDSITLNILSHASREETEKLHRSLTSMRRFVVRYDPTDHATSTVMLPKLSDTLIFVLGGTMFFLAGTGFSLIVMSIEGYWPE